MNRYVSSSLLVLSTLAFAAPAFAAAVGGCTPGVYLITEGGGTQSLWSFSGDGTLHTTSSAQGALAFGDGYGRWKQSKGGVVQSTVLDFSYAGSPTGSGFPPASVARVDSVLSFSDRCKTIEGSFELRFFDPASEDPLDPASDTGAPIRESFTGRRVDVP